MSDVRDLGAAGLKELGYPKDITKLLEAIQIEVADAYREAFLEMLSTMHQQASTLNRIQTTLNILVEHIAPQLEGKVPVAMRVAENIEAADLAKAVVVADPVGSGYMLSQADLAKAIGVPQSDVSVLVRAFKLKEDGRCAVVVRKGARNEMVNYHPRAVKRFLKLIANPPKNLPRTAEATLGRVRNRLLTVKAASTKSTSVG